MSDQPGQEARCRRVALRISHQRFVESYSMSLTKQQALDLFRSDDLIGIGMEADAVRRRLASRRRCYLRHRPQH